MRQFAALLALLAACKHPPPPEVTLEKDQFAALVQKAIGDKSEYDAKQFKLTLTGDGGGSELFLENTYREYQAAPPAEREGVLAHYVQGFRVSTNAGDDTLDQARPRLLPVIREGLYYQQATAQASALAGAKAKPPDELTHRPITEIMHLGLAIDRELGIQMLPESTLKKWGVSFDQLLAMAMVNLRERSTEKFDSPQPGLYVSPWRDNYDPSRMLLLDVIRKLPLKGAPVAMLPGRDSLILTGADDDAGLARMAELAEKELALPRAMDGIPLRLEGDKWVPFSPNNSPEIRRAYKLLEVESLGSLYTEQRAFLDQLDEKRKDDTFNAAYNALKSKSDGATSYCLWSEGVYARLPRADTIAFTDGAGKQLGFADWNRARTVLGPLMKPLGMSPERYRVDAFPTAKQLAALRLRAAPF